jgi:hypothetical protein
MARLGYDPQTLLSSACSVQSEYDMAGVAGTSALVRSVMAMSVAADERGVDGAMAPEEAALVPDELDRCFPEMKMQEPADEREAVLQALEKKVAEAVVNGLPEPLAKELGAILVEFADVFRLTLGRDPPVKMPPLKVHLKPGAQPVKCKARRYSLPQREFMQRHVQELMDAGFIYRNPRSRWCCAPLIVRKPHTKDEFRMTVDLRPVNGLTEAMAWPMPMLEVIVDHLRGAKCFSRDIGSSYCTQIARRCFHF